MDNLRDTITADELLFAYQGSPSTSYLTVKRLSKVLRSHLNMAEKLPKSSNDDTLEGYLGYYTRGFAFDSMQLKELLGFFKASHQSTWANVETGVGSKLNFSVATLKQALCDEGAYSAFYPTMEKVEIAFVKKTKELLFFLPDIAKAFKVGSDELHTVVDANSIVRVTPSSNIGILMPYVTTNTLLKLLSSSASVIEYREKFLAVLNKVTAKPKRNSPSRKVSALPLLPQDSATPVPVPRHIKTEGEKLAELLYSIKAKYLEQPGATFNHALQIISEGIYAEVVISDWEVEITRLPKLESSKMVKSWTTALLLLEVLVDRGLVPSTQFANLECLGRLSKTN